MLLTGIIVLVFLILSSMSRPESHPENVVAERDTTTIDLTVITDNPMLLSNGRVSVDGSKVGSEGIKTMFAREVRPEGSWWVLTDTSSMYPVPRRIYGDIRRMLIQIANRGPSTISPEAIPELAICLDSVYELIGYRQLGNAVVRNGRVIAWGDGEDLSTAIAFYDEHPWHIPIAEIDRLYEAGKDEDAYYDSLHVAEGIFHDLDIWCVYLRLHVPLLPPPSQDVVDVEIVYASSNPSPVHGGHSVPIAIDLTDFTDSTESSVVAPPIRFNVIDRRTELASP
jgi:hypothetical protein